MPTYIPTYLHTYIPTYIRTKSDKPYTSKNPNLQTLPYPTCLLYKHYSTTVQTLPYTTHTDNTRMCNEKITKRNMIIFEASSRWEECTVPPKTRNTRTLPNNNLISRSCPSGTCLVYLAPLRIPCFVPKLAPIAQKK